MPSSRASSLIVVSMKKTEQIDKDRLEIHHQKNVDGKEQIGLRTIAIIADQSLIVRSSR